MRKKYLFPAILFVIAIIYYLPVINLPLAPYDEAVILVGAERILEGQVPHKDFSSEYPVGQLYALAALFKVFGVSVFTERVYDLVIKALLSMTIFLIINLIASEKIALPGWIMSLVWLQHSSFPAYPVYPAMLFIFVSVYLLTRYMMEQKNYYVILSAVSIACAVLFRHDLGGYASIAISIVLIIRSIIERRSWAAPITFISGGLMTGLPVLVYFVMNSAAGELFNDLVLIPLAFLEKQALPYPSFSRWNLPFFIFPSVLVTGAVMSVGMIKRKRDDATAYSLLIISLIGIFCFNQARTRSDVVHLLPVALSGILLAPLLLHILTRGLSLSAGYNRLVYMLFVVVFGITLSKPVSVIMMLLSRTNGYVVEAVNPDIERARYSVIDSDLRDAVLYIKSNTVKDDKIYVGVTNHDQFVFNDVIIYFLAQRNCASRYHVLNPGVHTSAEVQEEVIREFEASPPRLVVLAARLRHEPNLSSIDTKIDLLDNYISTNYALERTFGIYEILIQTQ